MQHQAKQHQREVEVFQCKECSQTSTTPYNLRIHVQTAHNKDLSLSEAKACGTPVNVSTKGN